MIRINSMKITNDPKDIKLISESEMIEALKEVGVEIEEIRKSYKDARKYHLRCGKIYS